MFAVSQTFETLLNDLCIGEIHDLSFIDKAKILLTIRAVNVQPTLDVILTCPATAKTFNATLDILAIVDSLSKISIPQKCVQYDNLEICLAAPKKLWYRDRDFIDSIVINGEKTKMNQEIFENLPAKASKDIIEYVKSLDKNNNQKLIFIKSPYSDINLDIPISFSQNSILDFLKIAFKRDLLSLYELEYIACSKLNLDSNILNNSTFAELNIYINIFKKELEDRQKSGKQLTNPAAGPN